MSKLTLATLAGLAASLEPLKPSYKVCVAHPELEAKLRAVCEEMPSREISGGAPLHFEIAGIQIYTKANQFATAWMFSDDKLARQYLAGELTELDLVHQAMMQGDSGVCVVGGVRGGGCGDLG